jgi:hypothetical protein
MKLEQAREQKTSSFLFLDFKRLSVKTKCIA